ncbi:MAG: 50S ribosomal protein L13 [Candidatus Omnitrophica bacterium]|nr:50S ribosomal protein L13 [Candidatus Omnitrophota bacterium]MBU1924703.1 50S ribosomal protein L13 [Candidatus Omnitrophota bacterium]
MKTLMRKAEDLKKKWYIIDAEGKILGRMASKIATVLRGKNKADFTPHVDMSDHIVVVNAGKVCVTGKKMKDKIYQYVSGYPSGQKSYNLQTMLKNKPDEVIRRAVRGMLPHNTLGRKMLKRLKVYAEATHPHQEQKLEELKV